MRKFLRMVMDSYLSKSIVYKAVTMQRIYKRLTMVLADLLVLPLALWSAYVLRLSDWWPQHHLDAAWWLFLAVPLVGVFIFMRLGLYRAVVRFMGAQAIWAVVKGVLLLSLFLWVAAFLFNISPFPRSVPISFALVALVYVGGSRLLVRHYYHWYVKRHSGKEGVLIYGAGGAGIQLATALSDGREYFPVGFVDDDSSLWGVMIKGWSVYPPHSLSELVQSSQVKHVLLAVPQASNFERRQMLERLEGVKVHVHTIPSMPELVSGQASIEQIREVQIDELLGRDSVPPMPSLMAKCIQNKSVMITGAGGSIGSELCRQVINQNPKWIILLEISEYALYKIEQELEEVIKEKGLSISIFSVLGSVLDRSHIASIINHYAIDTIYHAAAYKHVPLVERNIVQGINNNIFGTKTLVEEATKANVKHFILVSTDKAVRPTNVMGATKRFAEMILQQAAKESSSIIFSMVRFGNVLGSSGSVVPLFREQIKQGGPITVTHQEITRFFMTIPEAASLVIQAGSMAQGGDVFVLDMGEPVKIVQLAKRMIQLSGLELKSSDNPEGDIAIEYTGLRPAEKLYEELLVGENVEGTEHTKIMRANEVCLERDQLTEFLSSIRVACDVGDCDQIRQILKQAVAGYRPHKELVDHLSVKVLSDSGEVVKLISRS